MSCLADYEYLVSPKADGERFLLLCDSRTNFFYLISPTAPPFRVEGTYGGPENIGGFLLEAEVVRLTSNCGDLKLVLAYDVCCIGSNFRLGDLEVEYEHGPDYYTIPRLQERRALLEMMVKFITIAGLTVKPISSARDLDRLWESWDKLPYPTDGLIFTPTRYSNTTPVLKWKPASKLTLDVALGGAIEQDSSATKFVAYLESSFRMHICGVSTPTVLPTSVDLVLPGHYPFRPTYTKLQTHHRKGQKLVSRIFTMCGEDEEDGAGDDILYAHSMDNREIEEEHRREAEYWCADSLDCSASGCPCEEVLSNNPTKRIMHCLLCGVLGVGFCGDAVFTCIEHSDHEGNDVAWALQQDIYQIKAERGKEAEHWCMDSLSCSATGCPCGELVPSMPTSRIMHCCQCGALGVGDNDDTFACIEHGDREDTTPTATACHVWIPNECAKWAKHGVVEVWITSSGAAFELRFKRLRRDRSAANSISLANTILECQSCPIELSQLHLKGFEGSSLSSESQEDALSATEVEMPSLYATSLSEKRQKPTVGCPSGLQEYMFDAKLPVSLERELLAFFSIPDLLRGRLVSRKWHSAIEDFDTSNETRRNFFDNDTFIVVYDAKQWHGYYQGDCVRCFRKRRRRGRTSAALHAVPDRNRPFIVYDKESHGFYQGKYERCFCPERQTSAFHAVPDQSRPFSPSAVQLYLRMGGKPPIPTFNHLHNDSSWDDDIHDYYPDGHFFDHNNSEGDDHMDCVYVYGDGKDPALVYDDDDDDDGNGIAYEHRMDIRQIERERREEAKDWWKGSLVCSDSFCPCDELLPHEPSTKRILHCIECGALGVGNDCGDDDATFSCIEHGDGDGRPSRSY